MFDQSLALSRLLVTVAFLMITSSAIVLEDRWKLRMVNVVFRHGDRTPSTMETYPNDPYINNTYYPIGRGGLTNEGKRRAYRLGAVLKVRYDDFLGSVYTPDVLEARSSDYDRTKMSLQLVLSALYPPAPIQLWNNKLLWQPIPTVYRRPEEDILFFSLQCPSYIAKYNRVKYSTEVQEKVAKFRDFKTSLEKLTGKTIDVTSDLNALYHTFDAQRAANLMLPDWVNEIYPKGELLKGANLGYQIMSYNDDLKRLNGGTLLRKISDDAVSYIKGTLHNGRKLLLYSGHEINVAALQLTLGVYEPHVPAYSSAVIIELWQLKDKYFFKVLHYTGIPSEVVPQKIPGCSLLCPLDKFLELLKPVTATNFDLLCV